MTAERGYIGGRFTLELDDKKPVGFVTSIDGGHFKSDMIQSPVGGRPGQQGGDFLIQRYPGKPKYDDITITAGMAMSPQFWSWVKATVDNKPERRDGALVTYDFNSKEKLRRTFKRALLAEIGFPACDAAAKSGQLLTVKISPEALEYAEGDNSALKMDQALNELQKQKRWTQSSFKFELGKVGGDAAMSQAKIEAFTIKQNVISNPVGSHLDARKEVGRLELPQLQVSFPESQGKKWFEWFKKTSMEGHHETTSGSLSYLAPNTNAVLLQVNFTGVGLLSLDFDKSEGSREGIARIKATLFVEGMSLEPNGKGTA